jgi:putative transposase
MVNRVFILTSLAFTGLLRESGSKASLEGQGAWMDKVFIERPWRGRSK